MNAGRVAALEALFQRIAATRMQGVPMLNERLRVEAVGFEQTQPDGAQAGVLVTPWFMNLVWLPPETAATQAPTAIGATRLRRIGAESFAFIGADEEGFGAYEACSLFSPMFEFVDHGAAIATARAVLDTLRRPQPAPPVVASRRALLLGRGAAGARP